MGLERHRVDQGPAVYLCAVAETAPDYIRLQSDEGISAPDGTAFHGFEQKGVGTPIRQLHEGRNRCLQIGHKTGIDDLGLARLVSPLKGLKVRQAIHDQR